ncbi:energy-coupling factor transport system substrate-specific component [Lachnospiraceae bacterium]|nr:energy-coupling factor transport system substrate-specific component [Lachnospiraceae bacterium]
MKLHTNKKIFVSLILIITFITAYFPSVMVHAADEDEQLTGGAAAVSGQADGVGYAAKLYDVDDGLPTSDANTILATSDGYIWIGSYSGLIRYDGTTFERQDSSGGITNVNAICEDSKGRLWVGTNDNGVVVTKGGSSTHFSYEDGLDTASISCICEDADGNILVGTKQGLYYFDRNMKLGVISDAQIRNTYISRLESDKNGNVYGVTNDGELFRIRKLRVTEYYNAEDLGLDPIICVLPLPDKEDELWIGTSTGQLYRGSIADDFESIFKLGSFSESVSRLHYTAGRLWIIVGTGLIYMDNRSNFHPIQNLPMNGGIENMTEDFEGNLWFASRRQGVMKIAASRFIDLTEMERLEPGIVNTTCLHNNMLFVGTDTGLQITDAGHITVKNDLTEYLSNTRVRCINEDNNGNLWISTFTNEKGLICYTKDRNIISYTTSEGLPSNCVRTTTVTPDGAVLVGTNGGLAVIRDGKVERVIDKNKGLTIDVILTVEVTDDGKYYLGSDGGGIYVIDGNNLTHLSHRDGLTSDVILRIKKDEKRGVIWIVTSNSIQYIKDGVIKNVEAFPYSNNYDIYFDSGDKAWILASNGIYVVNASDMINKKKFDYDFFNVADGLASVPTSNSFSCLDDNGDLYISGRSGVYSVNIENFFIQRQNIRFSVPYIETDYGRYYPDEKGAFRIPSSSRNITICGSALTYSMHDPEIQYYLDGADKQPIVINKSEMQPFRYTNLKGGTYNFKLALIDGSTHEVRQEVSYKIVKQKAFYEEWWFYLMILLIILMFIVNFVQIYLHSRTAALKKRVEENKRLFTQTATALVNAIDAKDKYTQGHSSRVADYSKKIAELKGMSEEECEEVYYAALLHDVGKIGVPSSIINKDTRLTDEEYEIIKTHPTQGEQILSSITEFPFLTVGALFHHERYDGRGYPNHIKATDIPEMARIIAVADSYDAMTSKRSYRDPMPQQKVREEFVKGSGTQFDPEYARLMVHMIDLDSEYEMKEREVIKELAGKTELQVWKHRSSISEGILLTPNMTTIRMKVGPYEKYPNMKPVPSLVLFDSLDGRVYSDERDAKNLMYFEYGEIWYDGRIEVSGARKMEVKHKQKKASDIKSENEYKIEAVKVKDHVLIRIIGKKETVEIITALPDSARFAYIGLTGEYCHITDVKMNKAETAVAQNYIPRIAEEISYLDGPDGDIPSVQINGYRTEASEGIPIKDGMKITFHAKSLPTARLVWHCPYINIYSADDAKVGGKNFRDHSLIRLDGECWEGDEDCKVKLLVTNDDNFAGWEAWKEYNKEGFDCTVTFIRNEKTVTVYTENAGISVKCTSVIEGDVGELYASLTGDQCAITNIRIE